MEIILNMSMINKSSLVTVKILPNKNDFTLALVFPILTRVIPTPIFKVKTIERINSAYFL